MILLTQDTAANEEIETEGCPVCQASVRIPCVSIITEQHDLHRLLAGSMNSGTCPTCGTSVTAQTPVQVNLPELGIGLLFYTPLPYLDMDFVCQGIADAEGENHVFYSPDELARQVQARIRLSQFSFNGLKADD